MAEWLILRLPRAADVPATWLVTDERGLSMSGPQSGTLAEAAIAAGSRRVCAMVGGGDVLNIEVELPVKGGARAAQVVPFALEEQLVGDIEQQHFALGRRSEHTGRTPVAVVARRIIDEWLTELRNVGIEPELLCSDSSLLPRNPGHVVALLDGEQLTVATSSDHSLPVTVPADDLETALLMALPGAELAAVHLLLHALPVDWQRRSAQVEALRPRLASLKTQLLNSGTLPWLAPQAVSGGAINLLQGDYAPRRSGTAGWQRWRLAAALLAGLLVLHAGGKAFELWQLQRAERQLDLELTQLGQQLLPGATFSASQLRQRVQQQLATRTGPVDSALLETLQSLAAAFNGNPGAVLQALSYREGNTDLKLRSSDAQSLERINQALRGAGLNAELVAGAAAGSGFEGRIQLKSAGAGR
jgi:general secretion pathway protein L